MKKLLLFLTLILSVLVSCEQPEPPRERGWETLQGGLNKLEFEIELGDITEIEYTLKDLNDEIGIILTNSENFQLDIPSFNAEVFLLLESLNLVEQFINEFEYGSIQSLIREVNKYRDIIQKLVGKADFDMDGVLNKDDKCPNSPLTEDMWPATVNEDGCSEEELIN